MHSFTSSFHSSTTLFDSKEKRTTSLDLNTCWLSPSIDASAVEVTKILEKALKEAANINTPDELETALRPIINRLPTAALEKLIQDQLGDVVKSNRCTDILLKRIIQLKKQLLKYQQNIDVLQRNVNDLSLFINNIDGAEGSIRKSTRNVGLQVRMKPLIFKVSPMQAISPDEMEVEMPFNPGSSIIYAPESSTAPDLTGVDENKDQMADYKPCSLGSEEIDLIRSDDSANNKYLNSGEGQFSSFLNFLLSKRTDVNFPSPVAPKQVMTIIHDVSLLNEFGDSNPTASGFVRKETDDIKEAMPPLELLPKSPSLTATESENDDTTNFIDCHLNRKRSLPCTAETSGPARKIINEAWYDPRLRSAASSIPDPPPPPIINKPADSLLPKSAAKKKLIVPPSTHIIPTGNKNIDQMEDDGKKSGMFKIPSLDGTILTRPSMREPIVLKGHECDRSAAITPNPINLPIPDLMPVSPYVEFIPVLKLKRINEDEAGVTWDIPNLSPMKINQIISFELFARQDVEPQEEWHRIAVMKALPLPMGCNISKFTRGYWYLFRIRTIVRCDEESFKTAESPFSKVTTMAFD